MATRLVPRTSTRSPSQNEPFVRKIGAEEGVDYVGFPQEFVWTAGAPSYPPPISYINGPSNAGPRDWNGPAEEPPPTGTRGQGEVCQPCRAGEPFQESRGHRPEAQRAQLTGVRR